MQRESCFLAGTSVTLGTGDKQAIETLQIGQRVLTPESAQSGPHSPLCGAGDSDSSETAVDPATWRSYTVRLRDGVTKWDVFDITLLRPAGWMAAQSRRVAGHAEVWVDFEELNAKGWAEVIEEAPCPPIAEGSGRVVTATITHANDDVRTLTMSSGETLYVTGNHRMYSATQADWVPVKDLRIGEELQTTDGRKSVASLGFQKGRHQVYNIEVEAEHCYFVGDGEVLTHNTCRAEAFNSAKKDAQIPTSQQPDSTAYVNMTDSNGKNVLGENGKPVMSREYTFTNKNGDKVVIQDHQAGHKFPDGGGEGAHFNVRKPEETRHSVFPGTDSHYNFDKAKGPKQTPASNTKKRKK